MPVQSAPPSLALSTVALSLICGLVGGLLGAYLGQPAAQGPAAAPEETRELRKELAAIRRSLDALGAQRAPAEVGGSGAPAPEPEGPAAALREEGQRMAVESIQRIGELREQMAAHEEQRAQRQRDDASAKLAELRTTAKNLTAEQTRENVARWLTGLGFSEEQVARIATASVPYVVQRQAVIMRLLEATAAGNKPAPDEVKRELAAGEEALTRELAELDDAGRAAVLSRINSRLRVPFFLEH